MQRSLLEGLWMSRMSAVQVLFIGPDSRDWRPLLKYLELFGGFQYVFCFPVSVYLFMLFLPNRISLPVLSLPVYILPILQGITHVAPPAGPWSRLELGEEYPRREKEWAMVQRQGVQGALWEGEVSSGMTAAGGGVGVAGCREYYNRQIGRWEPRRRRLKRCTKYFGPYSVSWKMYTYSLGRIWSADIFCLACTMFLKFLISFQHIKTDSME